MVFGFMFNNSSKDPDVDGLGAPGLPAGGGDGAEDGTEGGGAGGVPAGFIPGAVTDGIFPAMRASKMPGTGTGLGAESGAAGGGGTAGVETGDTPAEGGLAPTVRPGIGGNGGKVDPVGPSPAGGLAPTVSPAIGGSGAVGIEEPAGGFAPTVRPGIGGKADGTPEAAVEGDIGGLAPTVIPGVDGMGVAPEGGFTPKVASKSRAGETGLLAAGMGEAGVAVATGSFTIDAAMGVVAPAGFAFVAKVKISFVPGSAFSATAFPP